MKVNKNVEMAIKVMEKSIDNCFGLARMAKEDGDMARFDKLMNEIIATKNAINLLTDKNYLEDMCKIYEVE